MSDTDSILRHVWRLGLFAGTLVFALCGTADVLINEIHYDPDVKTEFVEFVELHNTSSAAVNLGGWKFSDGIAYKFPAGTAIAGNGYAVIASDPAAVKQKFGVTALGPWTGKLANEGERIRLQDSAGRVVDEVEYGLGFPWPTTGDAPGYSIELIHPSLDNDLGGSWRASVAGGASNIGTQQLIPQRTSWRYLKGTSAPSNPVDAWRKMAFDDSSWAIGQAPIGYGESIVTTALSDMRGNYTSAFLRRTFNVTDPSTIGTLQMEVLFDDGFNAWINGVLVRSQNMPGAETPYDASAGSALESLSYQIFVLTSPSAYLVPGENVIAIQAHNASINNSSDFFIDLRLTAQVGPSNRGPTPGARNSVYSDNAPPQIRQVTHTPREPASDQEVLITAKSTDLDGVASVVLHYQVVEPGSYIELTDAAYQTEWRTVAMNDAGTGGDVESDDSIFTVTLPRSVQGHRRLIRYRITATDSTGQKITVPYSDDPQPNFAYFVYDGVPAWKGAIQPNSTTSARKTAVTFGTSVMRRLPVYHLIGKASAVQQAQYGGYGGDQYRWAGTLVYDGKVYDHIRYRARGGVWRYAMGKNMWKFDFNRGHSFEARNNFGKRYSVGWDKLNLGACIQQGDYRHRGEQGMFESVGFRLFNMAGVESPHTHFVHFRVVDDAAEANPTNQYQGDLWGLYLAVEQQDGRFLDEHGLPDGNLYKMEAGTGELNNQGPTAATDKSDLNLFQGGYRSSSASDGWWRTHFDVDRYYSYQAIVQGIHHYDICYGKNYFYFLNPETGCWSVHPWDLDLTWADNMYDAGCGGTDEFKNRVLRRATFHLEYKNRIREIRDLLFNTDQLYQLIDEYAAMIHDSEISESFVAVDRAMWDYNPIMASSLVNPSKSGQGRFYQVVPTRDFPGMVRKMKDYVVARSAVLDNLAADASIPATPDITWVGPEGYPINRLRFRASEYSGASEFGAMQWRIGEVAPPNRPAYDPHQPRAYEIESLWDSGEMAVFTPELTVPGTELKVGRTYRARVRMKDSTGRWSHWSAPLQFVTGQPDNSAALQSNLQLTEVMYDPVGGTDFEFVELHNASPSVTLDLSGVAFTEGIAFTIPAGTQLAPGRYLLVVKADPANNFATFRSHYPQLDSNARIVGPFTGALANGGERIALETAIGGDDIVEFTYRDAQGWPVAADGAGHSLVPVDPVLSTAGGSLLDHPRNWRASTFIGGSPGRGDPAEPATIVINEFAAAPVSPGQANDWIELFNPSSAPVELVGWFLSDDADDLKRWPIPRTSIPPNSWVVFDQASGLSFGLSQSGEQLFLSHLPGDHRDRVVDAQRFKAQEEQVTLGRYPDGGEFFAAMLPTRGAANSPPLVPQVLINEVMYHPPEAVNGGSSAALEYIELLNPGTAPVPLFNATGAWRLDGGISFTFPANTTLDAGAHLLVVNFSATNTAAVEAFRSAYGLPSGPLPLVGPYTGGLNNSSDRVAVEKPSAPEVPGDPPAWGIIDEVIYFDRSPWPGTADGTGHALHRVSTGAIGNDPQSWVGAPPTPARSPAQSNDRDQDGLPDEWELAHGLDPNSRADAAQDPDNDGMTNLQEFLSGTDPRDPTSVLVFNAAVTSANEIMLRFTAIAGKQYAVQYRDSLGEGDAAWTQLAGIPAQPQTRVVQIVDAIPAAKLSRFYRVVVK